ncbi:hypothetical protein PoB_003959800 [Plakobranchus ocellatus]|uniref:Uncharacterized protein n=1 Tax=Plakobranchus ocellatus TaxID=259542 RepID=A0AAV4B2Y5_9GAST|nr:hypothetical protein PoB_003959800 [Plakobranchus ocellatus]
MIYISLIVESKVKWVSRLVQASGNQEWNPDCSWHTEDNEGDHRGRSTVQFEDSIGNTQSLASDTDTVEYAKVSDKNIIVYNLLRPRRIDGDGWRSCGSLDIARRLKRKRTLFYDRKRGIFSPYLTITVREDSLQ